MPVYSVTIFYYRSWTLETPGVTEERHVIPGVTKVVTVVPSKILSKEFQELEFTESIRATSMVEAVKIAVRRLREKAKIEGWDRYKTLPDGNTEFNRWDIRWQFEPYAKVEGEGRVWYIGNYIVPDWWVEFGPYSRFIGEIRGGGVTVNLNPLTGLQVTPWPTPPLPEPPWLSNEQKKRLFEQVVHPINWKYPTIPIKFTRLSDALNMAWSINHFQGGAELWELPNELGYAIMSKGYYHYVGG